MKANSTYVPETNSSSNPFLQSLYIWVGLACTCCQVQVVAVVKKSVYHDSGHSTVCVLVICCQVCAVIVGMFVEAGASSDDILC